jgi:hypothetical protein
MPYAPSLPPLALAAVVFKWFYSPTAPPLQKMLSTVTLLIAGFVANRFPYFGFVKKFAKFMV